MSEISALGSIETLGGAIDKYDIGTFAKDDPIRFLELVQHLCPRDQEIMICFAMLQKRPTELSILFGKAGHRAERDLHKAAHKLAGLAEFGPDTSIDRLRGVCDLHGLATFSGHSFPACIWQYSRCRNFAEVSRLIGARGLRQQMFRAFKVLHSAQGREEGLLAGWILWLVDGSDPKGKGWKKRKRSCRQERLGPTTFHAHGSAIEQLEQGRSASQKGGRRQRTANVRIKRKMQFLLKEDEYKKRKRMLKGK